MWCSVNGIGEKGTGVGEEWDRSGIRLGQEWDKKRDRSGTEWDGIGHSTGLGWVSTVERKERGLNRRGSGLEKIGRGREEEMTVKEREEENGMWRG
jgi:hypothetical protein